MHPIYLHTRRKLQACAPVLLFVAVGVLRATAQAPASGGPTPAHLTFQTARPWSPRTNINADSVMVYGIDETTASRIQSWREHGYHVDVMTGVAWGRYAPYLRGDFDGKEHWNETQQEKSGKLILHSGREVPYISPTLSYGRYLAHGVEAALDAGAEAIYLEEPEFWARAGWSDAFKQEWQEFYHESWQAPDSSPDAQYRASKLKYYLYRRALKQVFDAVREYGQAHHRTIPCYVATHSLINYAHWKIVSPESSLLSAGVDGYIAQVWTGTAREPNLYRGQERERTFETAFLEYGALQNIARSSGKPIWYLNDPIEDNPRHSWTDYKKNWESTLVASLFAPEVSRYELVPWPERIFGPNSLRPSEEPTPDHPNPDKTVIPEEYATELQTVFHALGQMPQSSSDAHWETAGTAKIGVLVSDTLMFQRADPEPSDAHLSQFYGLAMPLLMRGMPVEPVQIESTYATGGTAFLSQYKILFLTYNGQKPPSPEFHTALANWVSSGGALIVVDDDGDPYNKATDWWNSGGNHFDTPRLDLFNKLGLRPASTGMHAVGKGFVLYERQDPSALANSQTGADTVHEYLSTAAKAIQLPLHETGGLVLRRGPYVIAAGLDPEAGDPNSAPATVHGDLINLFDPKLAEQSSITLAPGQRAFLLDVAQVHSSIPKVLAASAKVTAEQATEKSLAFNVQGIDQTQAIVRILCLRAPKSVSVNSQSLSANQYQYELGRSLVIHFTNTASPQPIHIRF